MAGSMMTAWAVLGMICLASLSVGMATVVGDTHVPETGSAQSSLRQKYEEYVDEGMEKIRLGKARWDFAACSGASEKPLEIGSCYAGTRMGEDVMVKVTSFSPKDDTQGTGEVFVTGKGLSSVTCRKPFSINNQALAITDLEDCIPTRVKPTSMKYCSDQDHVVLNAHVEQLRDFEMILNQKPCPAEFLTEMSHTHGGSFHGGVLLESSSGFASACTGSDDPPPASTCYSGTQFGEGVTMMMNSFDPEKSTGSVLLAGSSVSPMKCSREFSKSGQEISVINPGKCLPATVKANSMRYCPDQDHILMNARVGPMITEMKLQQSPCPAVLLQQDEASDNDILDHSAWIWDVDTCTGQKDPPTHSPYCFTGSKMGEVVTIKVNSFDNKTAAGSVLVLGSGMTSLKCERGFSKAKEFISVPKLGECLPSTVKPDTMKYCSDQNQVLLNAKVGIVPVQLVLIPAPCPTALLETAEKKEANAKSLIQNEWLWESTTCTGANDPPVHGPTCYSGSHMGEAVTIKVHSFMTLNSTGSVLVQGSGLAKVACERSFLKNQQMISVTKLDECLPSTVKPSGLKYCSDQDRVILDATVASIPVEMTLDPTTCPESLMEDHRLVQGEIFASGVQRVQRLVRAE